MSILLATTLLYHYLDIAAAQTLNATGSNNSTATDTSKERIGWKSSPDGRSTMDIIWSCASVLLVCTYKCLHLNIPSFEEKSAGWRRTKRWGFPYWPEWLMIKKHLRKVKWMAIILIAPEVGVGIACCQYMYAREEVREAKLEFPEEELTLTHGFYAVAGGFAVAPRRSQEISIEGHQEALKLTKGNQETLWKLDLTTYVRLCKEQKSPIITEDDINDRSKSDVLTKAFAIGQSSWLALQSIARVSSGLPISEFELATIAYVVCAIVIYGLWWCKPFDVEHVTVMQSQKSILRKPWKKRPEINQNNLFYLLFFSFEEKVRKESLRTIIVNSVATLFSAIHLVAWNWEFSQPVSRTLWRSFGITSTASGPLILGITLSTTYFDSFALNINPTLFERLYKSFMAISLIVILVLYTISRIGLIVLVFYTFSSLPAAVYETIEWTAYLPHFS
ncbi:hypothetical protein BKA65DRAFT_499089 [Rhexocercosporidium sp. MPI-PUGE-AT-0058]|nr:hypothetical protein BKA65DRAFT_499089 [Rhexocercosporidium sp. MPI-PUGE-AT-0058]